MTKTVLKAVGKGLVKAGLVKVGLMGAGLALTAVVKQVEQEREKRNEFRKELENVNNKIKEMNNQMVNRHEELYNYISNSEVCKNLGIEDVHSSDRQIQKELDEISKELDDLLK